MAFPVPKSQIAIFIILLSATIFICIEVGSRQPQVNISNTPTNWDWVRLLTNNNNQSNPPLLNTNISLTNTNNRRKDYDYSFTVSYNNWIRGIGDNYLWNNETNSTCIYPQVPYQMEPDQAINTDIVYNYKHHCRNANSFSEIYDRIITAHCPPSSVLKYVQYSDIFHPKPPESNSTDWILIPIHESINTILLNDAELLVYTINLDNNSQTIWLSCGGQYQYHFSLLPLSKRNNSKYTYKAEQIDNTFKKIPPNIVIFIIDSTARSNFFRGATSTVEYLSNLQIDIEHKSPSDILEFFRYSTVGWGTGQNLFGLIAGTCNKCSSFMKNCVGLAQYFDSLGYESLGYDYFIDNKEGNRFPWQSGNLGEASVCDYYLSENVLPKHCTFGNDVYWGKEYALQSIKIQRNIDKRVPYFMALHMQANHVTSGKLVFQMDAWLRELVEYIDKENTVLYIVGDHGSLVGGSMANLFGVWEMRNPVSILMLPKWLNQQIGFMENMKVNQQRHTNHYDMHYFFKQLTYKLMLQHKRKEILEKIDASLPISNEGNVLSKSLMDTQIAVDRDCEAIEDTFCFCEVLQSVDLTYDVMANDQIYVESIVSAVNVATGNGEWDCQELDANQFVTALHLENRVQNYMQIVIEKYVADKIERDRLIKENRLLSYSASFHKNDQNTYVIKQAKSHGKNLPGITRLDYFKYEECLTTSYLKATFKDYDPYFEGHQGPGSGLEPIFINTDMTFKMLTDSQNDTIAWNLRVCHCQG